MVWYLNCESNIVQNFFRNQFKPMRRFYGAYCSARVQIQSLKLA